MPIDDRRERAALDAVEDAEVLATLVELIALPSVGGSAAEVEISLQAADRLSALGLDVDCWPLDLVALRSDPDFPGEEVRRDEAWGVVGTSTGLGHPAIILQGHLDVVPAGEPTSWTGNPYQARREADSIVGRGSCDMKGGVAAVLAAVAAVRRSGLELARPFAVQLVIGEEDGGLGAFATLRRGHRGEACVIPEPTDLRLITATAGALGFRIEVPGLGTHGSTRDAGSSAVDCYLGIHAALRDLERCRNVDPEPLLRDRPIPTRYRSGGCRPAPGRAPSPTCWSPRVGTAYA